MDRSLSLTGTEIDALKEIGNVGVGNGATALSKLVNKKVGIDLPDTKFIPINKFADEVGGAEKMVISLYLQITGDLKGECIFLFPEEGALELIDIILGQPIGTSKQMDEMGESAFKEMSNIFIGSYLNSLGNLLDLAILPSVPHAASDMAQAVLDFALINLSKSADNLLCVRTAIDVEGHNINGDFMMMFEEESLKKMLKALDDKYGITS